MDIEVFQNHEYVTTFYDVGDSTEEIFNFLCRFCQCEGYSITDDMYNVLYDAAEEFLLNKTIDICGYNLKLND